MTEVINAANDAANDVANDVQIKDPKAVLEALERAKADAKKFREAFEGLEKKWADAEQERTEMDARIAEYEAGEARWKDKTKELLVKGHLGPNADRLMKFIDMDSIVVDDDGEIAGIDEAVRKVKAELPELFDAKKRVGGAADLFDKGDAPQPASGTESQVRRIFRNR